MKLYRYSDDTFEFLNEENAIIDREATKRNGKEVYFQLANTTTKKPPELNKEKFEIAIFNKDLNDWEIKIDTRYKKFINIKTQETREITDRLEFLSDDYYLISDEDMNELADGKTAKLENGKLTFYFTQEQKEKKIRDVRNKYLYEYVDYYQEKPLLWAELKEEFKQQLIAYREYLLTYTNTKNWFEKEPLTFEEWVEEI